MSHLAQQLAKVRDILFPRRMCAKKQRYLSEGRARRVLESRQPHEPEKLYVYRCPECKGWHLTKLEQH